MSRTRRDVTKSSMSCAVQLVSFVFFCSGMSGLVYQIAWQRLLTVYYGVRRRFRDLDRHSVHGGPRTRRDHWWPGRRKSPAAPCCLSLDRAGTGAFGLASLDLLAWIGDHTAGSNYFVALWFMFLFLCIPTVLMGMTLPLVVHIVTALRQDFPRCISHLYFLNTLGAAFGALISSYGLISFFSLEFAVRSAAAVNFLLAALIFIAVRYGGSSTGVRRPIQYSTDERETLGRLAFVTVFAIGFLALGYEIIWLRMIGVLIKDSPYAFSTILAVYLGGVALGSYGMERKLRSWRGTGLRDLLFTLQAALALYVVGSVVVFAAMIR